MQVVLPCFDFGQQLVMRISLIAFLDAVDVSNDRTKALHLALVLIADYFLKDPLEHRNMCTGFVVRAGGFHTPTKPLWQGNEW